MTATIAIAEDEADLLDAVAEYLTAHGFRVLAARDGAAFRNIVGRETIDVAVLDISMPGEDGLSLARWVMEQGEAGIIFASAHGGDIDRVVGLELGADDYVVKPYDLRELLARIRAVLRRVGVAAGSAPFAAAPRQVA
ncbi:hypothetical protein GCM10007036_37120 [Alsobacter metallidurans]|uniref:Response regulatory domain-containing protein n=1 Tax=Alsobacter metallidurans TaxID=340221 RepID=A0A917ML71_9HYPH|nr:response regulator [Alsobacter metallidurans]GGH28112.1 hypothetical protein GCM10007036_37120 [Alsobacter metallidurans]